MAVDICCLLILRERVHIRETLTDMQPRERSVCTPIANVFYSSTDITVPRVKDSST
jgi:hypothetical protein